MAKHKAEPVQPDTEPMSTVNVDVEHDAHGHSTTTREVNVERDVEIDWTIDYGGDPVHPTSISSEGYTLPPVQPESS